jgi:hypothetical protein
MTSEASFAALAGTSPVDASSGKQRRHRLNRGGDRQLNWALRVVALARVRHHPETTAYYERLLATGKTTGKGIVAHWGQGSSSRGPVEARCLSSKIAAKLQFVNVLATRTYGSAREHAVE